MLSISVVIVTKNEEMNIEDALKSVSDAKEIIVVDSFSSDRTVAICRKYTEKVYQHKWKGFARQKQMAVDYAKGEWVLILDADERVTNDLRQEIIDVILKTDCNGFYIPRKNYFIGKWIRHGGWWPDYTLRLFRKSSGHFVHREVHERIAVDGKTGYLKNPLKHYTYNSISDYLERMDRYSSLASNEVRKKYDSARPIILILKPISMFFKMYIIRRGFLDGKYGFLLAGLYSYYTFLKYAKTWEKPVD